MVVEDVTFEIRADTKPFAAALDELQDLADGFGRQLTSALRGAVVSGKSLEDVLRNIGLNLAGMALSQALQPLSALGSSLFSGILGGIGGVLPFAKGGVVPFASGGVVSAPTFFPTGGKLGLMGEAGAEAILPLQRGTDGRLGVATNAGGATANIVFNVTTPDAASFRKSEAQITGMLARAVGRGSRTL
ncbi:phage tail tape measure protein [Nitratireductor sp. ZSWI3]|uniref:phage tail tape measure protein n=1 Tax=Nitratireductor sp. ZSWI3 TaxID=2966359 RepID=UPI00215020A6|nr:phage tail tape measure protein [Nitratireductor sp. ZSWI3]MCR4265358.1 phage tail tape measure protein [Nitratireductor sp. ZSWI3]